LADFIASVIRSRKRFLHELATLAEYDFGCIVVEGSIEDIVARATSAAPTRTLFSGHVLDHCRSRHTGFLLRRPPARVPLSSRAFVPLSRKVNL